jgi:NhaA family Na+:H+ antiporter
LLRLARTAKRPLDRFLAIEAASGILLLVAAAVAIVWASSPMRGSYAALWHTPLGVRVGTFTFERPLEWFVNDVLMVVFFFVVGMEIRREIHCGELSEPRRAALPAAAALGGMLVPAAIYLLVAGGPATRSGWGVPMATDIAFAVGVLTLLGKRVPPALRVLLLALAVIDDLGAIVVIAVFYSSSIALSGFWLAALGILALLAMQRFGVRTKLLYVVPAGIAWAGVYRAGIHPTIAGVVVGLLTPVRAWLGAEGLVHEVREELSQLEARGPRELPASELEALRTRLDLARREAVSPCEALIHALHPWVAFFIMPVFALANAGVPVSTEGLDGVGGIVALGAAVGLLVGKPLGVWIAIAAAVKLGFGALPRGIGFRHGIGFTMAIFIANLAFLDARLLAAAKLGILLASGVAAVVALAVGRALLPTTWATGAATSAHEAERSTEV